MKDAKPILWIKSPYYHEDYLKQIIDEIKNRMPDYHIAITFHESNETDLHVLNGEELTEEKYNALMEALKK